MLPAVTTASTSHQGWFPRAAYTPPSSTTVSPGKGGTTYSRAALIPRTANASGPTCEITASSHSTIALSPAPARATDRSLDDPRHPPRRREHPPRRRVRRPQQLGELPPQPDRQLQAVQRPERLDAVDLLGRAQLRD